MHGNTSARRDAAARHSRYLTSPSLPSEVQKIVAQHRCNTLANSAGKKSSSLPQLQSTFLSSTLGEGTRGQCQSLYSRSGTATLDDPLFSDTLSNIGPSARKLLELDEKRKASAQKNSFLRNRDGTVCKSKRKKTKKEGWIQRDKVGNENNNYLSPSFSALPELNETVENTTLSHSLQKNAKSGTRNRTFMTTISGSLMRCANDELGKDGLEEQPFKATIIRKPDEEPPLVQNLKKYLHRELRLVCGGVCVPQSVEALGPYREVFRAITSSFPGYASLFCDIQSAYDNVLQAQSELLDNASSKDRKNLELAQKYKEDTTKMSSTIAKLEADLIKVENTIKERDHKVHQVERQRLQAGSSGARSDNLALRKQLEMSTRRVEELEESMKGDSEKILVLIGAVRECDKRLKAYEAKVSLMSGQVEELNEFQRLAGEAQGELQNYKHKFRSYVSAEDFEVMKNHLSQELVVAQQLVRHLRRTAAVRSTQVDVMMRKVRQLEGDQRQLVSGGSDLDDAAGNGRRKSFDARRKEVLTPRPNWEEIYKSVPELREHVKPIHNDSIPAIISRVQQKEETTAQASQDQNDGELLVVDALNNSSSKVEFLVQAIKSLKEEVEIAQNERNDVVSVFRQERGRRSSFRGNTPNTDGPNSSQIPSSRSGFVRRGSGVFNSGRRRSMQNMMKSLGNIPLSTVIICPGTHTHVPECIRCTGVVDRLPVPFVTASRIVYQFFLSELLPMLELRELSSVAHFDFSRSFLRFLEKKMPEDEGLQKYACAPYVALNIIEDSKDPELRTPALVLLVHIILKTMPVRIALDATLVVKQVVDDMTAIAKEQQKSRLRRQALTECLAPVLELKTVDEIAELRAALGTDVSFDLYSLINIENRFLRTFFYQQCQSSMDMYKKLLTSLSARSNDMLEDTYDKLITLDDLKTAIYEAEPKTPEVIVRELTENSTRRNEEGAAQTEEKLRLTDVIAILDVSPIFLRTPKVSREQCTL